MNGYESHALLTLHPQVVMIALFMRTAMDTLAERGGAKILTH